MPSLSLAIGTAAAKAAVRLWLKNTDAADLSASLVDIIAARVPGEREQRRATRSFERLAEDIADRLSPFIETELPGLPMNERNAACLAVADALNATTISDELLFSVDLESIELERAVRLNARNIITNAILSEPAAALFNRVLREACAYIVAVRVSLPTFTSRVAVELLRRETEIQQILAQVVERLPVPDPSSGTADADFELRYRRTVALQLDRLELFGLSVSELARRYTLTVAYISLTATSIDDLSGFELQRQAPRRQRPRSKDDERDYVRIEEVLAGSGRTVIRGGAGSGKTTLLQWVAVRSARREFNGELAEWNEAVPFFIPLRRYVGRDLPRPEQFLEFIGRNLSGVLPSGWVHGILAAGRGLVLVDGVDELPEAERPRARQWLADLTRDFPDSRYLVTSRPAAVTGNWLAEYEFAESELQPMTVADISAFVHHWHAALAEGAEEGVREDLDRLSARLVGVIRDSPPLRNLATSPLLCAMLCALNRDRRTQLPRDRLELYRISLETLLERRDVEREVLGEDVALSLPQKELLLRSFAHWLMLNNQSDAERDAAVSCIERRLEAMPNVVGTRQAESIFSYLLERSGMLREPVVGRIDFVHRTFQEYLAAVEVVEQDSIGMIIERAHEDEWREVVILAAGHARVGERVRLIEGLLERGERQSTLRHRLHLLAVACLETARQLPTDLVEVLQGTLQSLVPPRNLTEARALASAGDLAVPLLAAYASAPALTAAACVRTLALIGTPEALETLTHFSSDSRVTVTRELLRAWGYFDPGEYADRVLADCALDRGKVVIREASLVPFVSRLRRAESVTVELRRHLPSIEILLPVADRVRVLDISGSTSVRDFEWLAEFAVLRSLSMSECAIKSLDPVRRLSLAYLDASRTSIDDLSPIAAQPLRTLIVSRTPVSDLSAISSIPTLEVLDVSFTQAPSLAPMASLPSMRALRCGYTTIEAISSPAPLRSLWAPETSVRTLEGIHTGDLRSVSLFGCRQLANINALSGAHSLRRADFSRCTSLNDFEAISGARALVILGLRGVAPSSWEFLRGLPYLHTLNLSGCSSFTDGSVLQHMPQLSWLNIAGTGLSDYSFLSSLPGLRWLLLDPNLQDIEHIRHLLDPGVQALVATGGEPSPWYFYWDDDWALMAGAE